MRAFAAPPQQEFYQGRYASVSFLPANETAIVRIHGAFIPMTDYQATLHKVGELAEREKIQKLVVDAPHLVAYHQPSVEWAFVNWRKRVEPHGLCRYRYVLPDSGEYRQLLENGLRKIRTDHPETGLDRLDVACCRSLDEAVEE